MPIELMKPPALDLSLYHLDAGLSELLEYRQQRIADIDDPPTDEEMGALDAEIRRYELATPAKVSGVAAQVRHWRSQLDIILGPKDATGARRGGEVDRLRKVAAHIEAMEDWFKSEYLKPILEGLPEPKKGCRKLIGADGSQVMLKGNGGLQPLHIQDDVLPDEYRDATVMMPLGVWKSLAADLDKLPQLGRVKFIEPANGRIREALKDGAVPGAWLEERGSHIEVK